MTPAPKRARGRLKEVSVDFETFQFRVYCVAGPYEDLPPYMKHRHRKAYTLPEKTDADGLYFDSTGRYGGVIWIPCVPRTPHHYGVLAHEVGHAVIEMMGCRELPLSTKHQEPFCYALAHGVETILKELRK